tara:strand:+ start:86 stop:313 length:228 start_codon:yes stop_codon:yes gene_type:complete
MQNKLKKKLKQKEFYCVKCRKRVLADDICVQMLKNKKVKGGVPTLSGYCNNCDTLLYKFIKHADKSKLNKKFGKC